MHLGAAKLLVGRDLAGRGAKERRTGEKDFGAAAHQDRVVRKARQISAAGGRGAVNHGDLRNACRRQPRLIGKAAPAFDKHLGLKKQIGAAGFDQPHHRQLVLHRHLLDAQMLLHAHRRRRAAFDGAVIGGHDAADTRDIADAGNATAALNAFGTIIVVHAKAGERRQFEPWRPGIEHQRHALARQQLFAGAETVAFGIGDVAHFLLQRAKFADQRQHLLTVGAEALGIRIDAAFDDRHGNLARTLVRRRI